MMQDTFNKITEYRKKVQSCLDITHAVATGISNLLKTRALDYTASDYQARGNKLCIETSSGRAYYINKDKLLIIPQNVSSLEKHDSGADATFDQIFEIVVHLQEEVNIILAQISNKINTQAQIIIESLRESAVNDLL